MLFVGVSRNSFCESAFSYRIQVFSGNQHFLVVVFSSNSKKIPSNWASGFVATEHCTISVQEQGHTATMFAGPVASDGS